MPISIDKKKEEQMVEMRKKEAEDLAKILSQKYQLPYLDISRMTIDIDAIKIIDEKISREGKVAIFQKIGRKLQVALESPNPEATQRTLRSLESDGYKLNIFIVSEYSLNRVWKRYAEVPNYDEVTQGIIAISGDRLEKLIQQTPTLEKLKEAFASSSAAQKNNNISDVAEIILAGAISADASDIHIEPQEDQVRLRFRLDGVLHDILFLNYKTYILLLSRIKLVSGLKLNIRDQAQDGRFSIKIGGEEIEIRTSVIPEAHGESIVLRILNPKSIAINFDQLGLEPSLMEIMNAEMKKPNGMILTTGPTGSGKTTTLYAFLKNIYTPYSKMITLEDPVEYHLRGIVQTQVNEAIGYSFSSGLRSILRQDPDIIMVGEIRDSDTAKTAINSALTGHLVLSTLHTNNAAGTIPRLIDLGINPSSIAPAVNVVMAQRLIRKLCNHCKKKRTAAPEEAQKISKVINSFPPQKTKPGLDSIYIWEAIGCEKCNKLGYKGRIGVYEAILIDENIESVLLLNPSEGEIIAKAKNQGILNMSQDGIMKVLNGTTSLDELERVVEL